MPSLTRADANRVGQNLLARIDGVRLSPGQRRIASYLVDNAAEAVFLTSAQLAERVGASQSSVTRFAFALGFSRFAELRDSLREAVLTHRGQDSGDANRLQTLVDTEIHDLTELRRTLADPSALQLAATRLATTRPLPVLGLRVSAPLAQLFGYFAAKVHPDVRVLTDAGSLLLDRISTAADAGATWMLAYGLPRYPRELAEALDWAHECGLSVVLITDKPTSVLAERAELVLAAGVSSAFAFDSQAAPTVLTTALVHTLLDHLPGQVQKRLDDFETSATTHTIFVD